MSEKFRNIPFDPSTSVLFEIEATIGVFAVLYQVAHRNGSCADRFVFAHNDIAELTDEQLTSIVKTSPVVRPDAAIELKHLECGYTVVDFSAVTH